MARPAITLVKTVEAQTMGHSIRTVNVLPCIHPAGLCPNQFNRTLLFTSNPHIRHQESIEHGEWDIPILNSGNKACDVPEDRHSILLQQLCGPVIQGTDASDYFQVEKPTVN